MCDSTAPNRVGASFWPAPPTPPRHAGPHGRLKANDRATVRDSLETHLRHEPTKLSRSRIKRLRKMAQPQYRLRAGDIRVFYDVNEGQVEVLAVVPKSEAASWLAKDGKSGQAKTRMKEVPLAAVKDDLSRYLREAERGEIVITRHGKPAGVLIGFKSEEEWFDFRLENDPRFLARVAKARESLRAGRGVRLEDIKS